MKTLSLVMITKNEELKIRRCLESIKDFVNEIIIVDTGSIDKTKEIALEFGAKIFDYEWNNNFFDDAIILYIYNLTKLNQFEKGLKIIDNVFDLMNNSCDFYFACGVFFTELVAFNPEKYMNYLKNIELCYLGALQLRNS